jgi:hypothetical protein
VSTDDAIYRVLYLDGDGHERLTAAMSYDAARSRAKTLEAEGYTVGSVMGDVAARGYMHAKYAPEYRGVRIPGDLRADDTPRGVFETWKRGVDAALDLTVPVVEALHDDSPCHLDHHGYCQEHGLPQPGPCPERQARVLLAVVRKDEEENR